MNHCITQLFIVNSFLGSVLRRFGAPPVQKMDASYDIGNCGGNRKNNGHCPCRFSPMRLKQNEGQSEHLKESGQLPKQIRFDFEAVGGKINDDEAADNQQLAAALRPADA